MTDLRTYRYRIRLVHELKDTDAAQRLNFANAIFSTFLSFRNISFSGKAHFHIDRLETNETAAVGAAKNTKHHNSKIRYVSTWHKPLYFWTRSGCAIAYLLRSGHVWRVAELHNIPGYNTRTRFNRTKRITHTSNTCMPIVNRLFPNKVSSSVGNVSWLPLGPDLTPMDYWVIQKSMAQTRGKRKCPKGIF